MKPTMTDWTARMNGSTISVSGKIDGNQVQLDNIVELRFGRPYLNVSAFDDQGESHLLAASANHARGN